MPDIDGPKGSPGPQETPKDPDPYPIGPEGDPGGDPYSTAGMKQNIVNEIYNALAELKSGHMDVSEQLIFIFGKMQSFSGNVVGQDSETQTMMTGYISGSSELQKILGMKPNSDGSMDQTEDINQYTGKPEAGTKVDPEVALGHECEYLLNNPKTEYKLGADGKPLTDAAGNKIKNPAYNFFNAHPDLYSSIQSNVEQVLDGLGDSSSGGPGKISHTGTPGYSDDGSGGESITFPDGKTGKNGFIANMWNKATTTPSKSGSPGTQGDPTILQAVQTAMGSVSQSYTSSSSASQALAKTDTQTFTSAQGNFNKFLQAFISQVKSMVQGQKTSG